MRNSELAGFLAMIAEWATDYVSCTFSLFVIGSGSCEVELGENEFGAGPAFGDVSACCVRELADSWIMNRTSRRLIWYSDPGLKDPAKTTRGLLPKGSSINFR